MDALVYCMIMYLNAFFSVKSNVINPKAKSNLTTNFNFVFLLCWYEKSQFFSSFFSIAIWYILLLLLFFFFLFFQVVNLINFNFKHDHMQYHHLTSIHQMNYCMFTEQCSVNSIHLMYFGRDFSWRWYA